MSTLFHEHFPVPKLIIPFTSKLQQVYFYLAFIGRRLKIDPKTSNHE
jgi:hypothetical protein